jgi:DNA-binding transcriptional LysR family regulator
VRRGSVTAAAEELVVTQPSVSAAVAALEREIGVQLTERAGRGIRPTPAGEAYARYATDVLALLREGQGAAADAAEGVSERVRVAAVTTAGEFLVPALLRSHREVHPDLDVSVYVGNREEVFRRLAAREADLAISGRPPEEGGFHGTPFLDNDFVLIAAESDPLAARPWVAVEDLGARSWLMREQGSGTRRLCEAYLASHQLQPSLLTLGSNGAIKNAARMGLGIALQSRVAVEPELAAGHLATINPRGGLPKRQWHVVRSATGPVSAPVEAFAEYVRASAADALARPRNQGAQAAP